MKGLPARPTPTAKPTAGRKMKAIVYERYGPPEVLHVAEIERPTPKRGEVLIRVRAAEVTKADCELRSFKFPVKWFWLPMRLGWGLLGPRNPVLGGYFSGVVEAIGKGVSRFSPGDEVFGASGLRMGAYGEYACLSEGGTICPKPRNMSFEEAAAVPLGGLNALHFMQRANIARGESVLVNGAGGSIGIYAVQIAKEFGAEVTAVDGGAKEHLLRKLGVDHFVDYTRERFQESGESYDVIFDMVARKDYSGCVAALNPKGRYLMGNPRLSDMFRSVLTTHFTDRTAVFAFAGEKEEQLRELALMIEQGKLRAALDGVFSRRQAAEAHRRVETERRMGAVVIVHD